MENTKVYPVSVEHLKVVTTLPTKQQEREFILNGKTGAPHEPKFIWTLLDSSSHLFKQKKGYPNLLIAELDPKKKFEPELKDEFERVKEAFDLLVGVEGKRIFQLGKVEIIKNSELEKKFVSTFKSMHRNQIDLNTVIQQMNELTFPEQRREILSEVCYDMKNICLHF